jgi:hypothetical protein
MKIVKSFLFLLLIVFSNICIYAIGVMNEAKMTAEMYKKHREMLKDQLKKRLMKILAEEKAENQKEEVFNVNNDPSDANNAFLEKTNDIGGDNIDNSQNNSNSGNQNQEGNNQNLQPNKQPDSANTAQDTPQNSQQTSEQNPQQNIQNPDLNQQSTSQNSNSTSIVQDQDLPDKPVYYENWIKYIHIKDASSSKPKSFYKNDLFELQSRDNLSLEKFNEKDEKGIMLNIPSELHFYIVLYKSSMNILSSRKVIIVNNLG